jgi:CubicO group peptidase (beta-lactamase class C family)
MVAYGSPRLHETQPVTSDTLFEIGSITKILTACARRYVRRKEVCIDDPALRRQRLPHGHNLPRRFFTRNSTESRVLRWKYTSAAHRNPLPCSGFIPSVSPGSNI